MDTVVIGGHMLSRFTARAIAEEEFQVRIITNRDQGVVSIDIRDRPLPAARDG